LLPQAQKDKPLQHAVHFSIYHHSNEQLTPGMWSRKIKLQALDLPLTPVIKIFGSSCGSGCYMSAFLAPAPE